MWIVHTSASIEPHRINWNYPIEIKKKWRETKRKKNYLYENWKERINKQKRNHVCVVNAKKSHARQESNKISPFTWNHDVTSFDEQQYVYFYHYLLRSVFHFFCMLFFLFIVCCLRNKWRGASLLLGSGEYNFRQHVYMILFVIPISSIDFHCSRHSLFHVRSNSQKKKTPVIIVSMCSVFCVHSHDYVHLKSNGNHGIHNLSRAHDLEWNVIEI